LFTKHEWMQKNEWYAVNTPASLSSLDVEVALRDSRTWADVTVFRRFELYERTPPRSGLPRLSTRMVLGNTTSSTVSASFLSQMPP
jgi:hypothetical protein